MGRERARERERARWLYGQAAGTDWTLHTRLRDMSPRCKGTEALENELQDGATVLCIAD